MQKEIGRNNFSSYSSI